MDRIASLLPSTTEIACALGFESALVGRSHECDFPASVAALPVLTAPKLDANASSREIDDRVEQLVRDGLSVYRVDATLLRELSPTLILTQDQCEVCAASLSDVEAALADRVGGRPRIVSLDPATTHVYMCGNPAMIGIPDEEGVFPATTGVVELLVERGFTIDKRGQPGNIHYEEYW